MCSAAPGSTSRRSTRARSPSAAPPGLQLRPLHQQGQLARRHLRLPRHRRPPAGRLHRRDPLRQADHRPELLQLGPGLQPRLVVLQPRGRPGGRGPPGRPESGGRGHRPPHQPGGDLRHDRRPQEARLRPQFAERPARRLDAQGRTYTPTTSAGLTAQSTPTAAGPVVSIKRQTAAQAKVSANLNASLNRFAKATAADATAAPKAPSPRSSRPPRNRRRTSSPRSRTPGRRSGSGPQGGRRGQEDDQHRSSRPPSRPRPAKAAAVKPTAVTAGADSSTIATGAHDPRSRTEMIDARFSDLGPPGHRLSAIGHRPFPSRNPYP